MGVDSSLIFLVVIGLWAAYLVPQWLRRREQLSASRSGDRFSAALRVLTRRPDPGNRTRRTEGRPYVLTPPPALAIGRGLEEAEAPALVDAVASDAGRARLPLLGLVVVGLLLVAVLAVPGTVALVVLSVAPLWAPAAALGGLVVLLVTLRLRARRRRRAVRAVGSVVVEPSAVVEGESVADEPSEAPHVDGPSACSELEREPLPGEWTPVPVPLPSYLLKDEVPRRRRPTLELDEVSRWHADWREPATVVQEPARPEVDDDDIPTYAPPARRAIGA